MTSTPSTPQSDVQPRVATRATNLLGKSPELSILSWNIFSPQPKLMLRIKAGSRFGPRSGSKPDDHCPLPSLGLIQSLYTREGIHQKLHAPHSSPHLLHMILHGCRCNVEQGYQFDGRDTMPRFLILRSGKGNQ